MRFGRISPVISTPAQALKLTSIAAPLLAHWILVGLLLITGVRAADAEAPVQLGLQSWTCRFMSFDELVQFAERQHIKYIELCDRHLDPFASPEVVQARKSQLVRHGLIPYAFGVVVLSNDAAKNQRLFQFARALGVRILVADCAGDDAWDEIEREVKRYDIRVAIHNHGPGSPHANPLDLKHVLEGRDARIGFCLDVGHLTSCGLDAATVFRQCHDRVFDFHLKDKRPRGPHGQYVDTFIGQGITRCDDLFAAITALHWHGVMALEADSGEFAQAPDAFVTATRAYFAAKIPSQP